MTFGTTLVYFCTHHNDFPVFPCTFSGISVYILYIRLCISHSVFLPVHNSMLSSLFPYKALYFKIISFDAVVTTVVIIIIIIIT